MPIDIPFGLRNAIESGRAVLFIGAGVGYSTANSVGDFMPTADALADRMASHFKIPVDGKAELPTVSELVEIRHGRVELTTYVASQLSDYQPNSQLQWLVTRTWRAIFTTNYDRLIARCYELSTTAVQQPVVMATNSAIRAYDTRFQVPVYHLHGALFDVDSPNILITDTDYATYLNTRDMLFNILKTELATSPILYAGYSNTDPNWKTVLAEVHQKHSPTKRPQAYRVTPSTHIGQKEILESRGISPIDATLDDFVNAARAAITHAPVAPTDLQSERRNVPQDLIPAFEQNASATLRLLNSWTYVNQEAFAGTTNSASYFRGDRPNWPTIAAGINFRRDIEDTVYEDLLDYATSSKVQRPVHCIAGPAGSGITTTLMSLAVRLVKEAAGPVFMHRPGTAFNEGDIDYAASLLGGRPFFVVDNASRLAPNIESALTLTKTNSKCFLIGDRLNSWRSTYAKPKAKEYLLDRITDNELPRLLQALTKANELGILKDLPPELQAAAIRSKHNYQLLVTLREATEGRQFDAIIEDEYRQIHNPVAQRMYSVVSCAYHLRFPLRDAVLAKVLGISSIEQMYDDTRDVLDGVIEFDVIDNARGIYAARCRHQVIAAIVWERCVTSVDKEMLLQTLLETLNLFYESDRELFDELVKSDRQIDNLSTFGAKTRFFETATRMDPSNSYVHQHYARMLLRERRLELAQRQIDHAIRINPKNRILYHTKGMILKQLALDADSVDIGRRWLVQSEGAFRQAIQRAKDDAFNYQSLGELYLGWATKVSDDNEQVIYISKCEEVITEGLKVARERDGLWILSAKVQSHLQNHPRAIDFLKRVASNPIGRYILGKRYLMRGEPDEAKNILFPLVTNDPNEYRAVVAYADALVQSGSPLKDAIAALRLANLHGMNEPKYIATLGGMLFLNGQFSEAQDIFNATKTKRFTAQEERSVNYIPRLKKGLAGFDRMQGTIAYVSGASFMVESTGWPRIFGIHLTPRQTPTRGLKVRFRLAFNALGPIALNVRAMA